MTDSKSNEAKVKKPRVMHTDRVTLSVENLNKVNLWTQHLNDRIKGTTVARCDLVNWLIRAHPEQLSSQEMNQLHDEHFDEITHYDWAVKMAKKARAEGKQASVSDFLNLPESRRTQNVKKNYKKKEAGKSVAASIQKVETQNTNIKKEDNLIKTQTLISPEEKRSLS